MTLYCALCRRPPEQVELMMVDERTGASICSACTDIAHAAFQEQRAKKPNTGEGAAA